MPAAAFTLALGAAFLHALWNLLLARERDPEPATAVAICASVVVFGIGATAAQAAGVCLVGVGILLVRGLGGERDLAGGALAVAIASSIAAYTLVDKSGIRYADPIVYLELAMVPTALGALLLVAVLPSGRTRLRGALRPTPAVAGIVSFVAYVLVLAALQRAPAASVAAVRETSVLIVAALAAPT